MPAETAVQRRTDDLRGVGCPGRRKNKGLGMGIDLAVAMVKDQRTQLFAYGGAAGFTGAAHGVPPRFQFSRKPGRLRRLAGTIATFECDEYARLLFAHLPSLPSRADIS